MKHLVPVILFLIIDLLFTACGQTVTTTPLPIPSPAITATAAFTPILSSTATATLQSTPPRAYPTLLPTIDPKSAPQLLRKAITIQTYKGVNGHAIKQITGWDYGFQQQPDDGYQWLDSDHLLLYPRTGEGMLPYMDGSTRGDLSSQPVIINLENGHLWLPRSNTPTSIYFSHELEIIFVQESYGSAYSLVKDAVFTYTLDGREIARYWGKILGISPSGTKILVDDDTIIDLRNNKTSDLAWYMDYDLEISSKLYWSSDETRVYRCCFYFADLKTGESYNFEWSDLRGADGKPAPFSLQPHTDGQWVRNDTYFFVKWDYWSYAGSPTVILSPVEKKYYVIEIPDTPIINPETLTYTLSPDGKYAWIKGYGDDGRYHNFLSDLMTLKTVSYDIPIDTLTWSADGRFGWGVGIDSSKPYVLSVASKKLEPFPVDPIDEFASWHPKESVLAYLAENNQALALLTAKDVTIQGRQLPVSVSSFLWSPDGAHIVFVSTEGSLWQVDYPKFQNFEQLTEPLPGVHDALWSPDGNFISFISGSDIYIVETTSK